MGRITHTSFDGGGCEGGPVVCAKELGGNPRAEDEKEDEEGKEERLMLDESPPEAEGQVASCRRPAIRL